MKDIRSIVVVLLLLVGMLVASCGSRQPISLTPTVTEQVTTQVEEIKRDTVIYAPADASYYKAYLDCVNGKVVVKDAEIKRSKNKALQPPSVNINKDNVLEVDCTVKAQELFFEWRDKFIREFKVKEIKIPVPVPLELSGWQRTQIWLGRCFLGLVSIMAFAIGWGLFNKQKY